MPMNLVNSMNIAASGMKAQSDRLRIVAENIANADSTGLHPGDAPYRRKTVTFKNVLDKQAGVDVVRVSRYSTDKKTQFPLKYDPGNPASNPEGYVQMPNVNPMVEMMDMREASKSYEANVGVIEVSKGMIQNTLGLIK